MPHGSARPAIAVSSALAVALVSLLALAPVSRAAEDEVDVDALHEDLSAATARLEYTLDKLQRIGYPMGGEDRRMSRDLVARGRSLMKSAATVPGTNADGIRELTGMLKDLKDETNEFLARVSPVWQDSKKVEYTGKYRSPYMEVVKYRDVAEGVAAVRHLLTPQESARFADATREAEDAIAAIKETRESDHAGRDVLVRQLMGLRRELQEMQGTAETDRTTGYPFVALRRSHAAWTDLGHAENGLEALRTRFVEPQSAWITLRNPGDEWRPVYIELQFADASGSPTGTGTFETAPLEELRSGEVREVLVPIHPTHPQFWEVTRSFTVSLN